MLQNSKKETLFLTAFLTLQTPLQSPSTPKDGNLKIQIFPHTHPHSWVVLILEATHPTLDSISSFSVNFVFVCRRLSPYICHCICLFYLNYDFHDICLKLPHSPALPVASRVTCNFGPFFHFEIFSFLHHIAKVRSYYTSRKSITSRPSLVMFWWGTELVENVNKLNKLFTFQDLYWFLTRKCRA